MNRLVRHRLFITSLLLVALVFYAVILLTLPESTAAVVGIAYVGVIVTLSLAYDVHDARERRRR